MTRIDLIETDTGFPTDADLRFVVRNDAQGMSDPTPWAVIDTRPDTPTDRPLTVDGYVWPDPIIRRVRRWDHARAIRDRLNDSC